MKIAILLMFCVLVACGGNGNSTTNNGTTNNGTTNNGATTNGATNNGATNNGTTNNGATNNGATNNGIPEATAAYVEAIDLAGGIASAMGGGLRDEGTAIRNERDGGTDTQTGTRDRFETGVARDSVVNEPTCATFDWTALTATVTFDNCTFEQTGSSLTGTLTAAITFTPLQVTLTFDSIAVDGRSVDGSVILTFSSEALNVEASLGFDTAQGATTLDLDGAIVVSDTGIVVFDGTGALTTPAASNSLTASGITWVQGDCPPSDGSAVVTTDGTPTTMRFLSSTPATGEVEITVPPFPATTAALLEPCPYLSPIDKTLAVASRDRRPPARARSCSVEERDSLRALGARAVLSACPPTEGRRSWPSVDVIDSGLAHRRWPCPSRKSTAPVSQRPATCGSNCLAAPLRAVPDAGNKVRPENPVDKWA